MFGKEFVKVTSACRPERPWGRVKPGSTVDKPFRQRPQPHAAVWPPGSGSPGSNSFSRSAPLVLWRLDGDPWQASNLRMTGVTSKTLHEKTGQLLVRARPGEVPHPAAWACRSLSAPAEAVDSEWPEIMAEVWRAQKGPRPKRPNPILKERRTRNYAARLR
jgi:hypothetical protein